MTRWRIIIDGPADGCRNMAVDRAILAAHAEGQAPPTLRLYRFAPPTVSIGRFQNIADVDVEYCREHGIGICRRPTGGRGVLHDDELTYSIVAGVADGLPRGVRESYRYLSGALAEAYRALGVDATLTARDRGSRGGACYLHATGADLSLGAAKLSGSAQVWDGDSCLQHGSFVITRDVHREAQAFMLDDAARDALGRSTATIADATGRRPGDDEIAAALIAATRSVLGAQTVRGDLSNAERAFARSAAGEYRIGT
ncbi:MAG: lipoate--protein ligase family protein [Coriobacteriia bacterium]|nr:lipoate--protein ligase family protein [Coriobacteriia bacterium]MBN2840140.1 lipoate--protein ligase family protein [Coriobacteriia bacterium]